MVRTSCDSVWEFSCGSWQLLRLVFMCLVYHNVLVIGDSVSVEQAARGRRAAAAAAAIAGRVPGRMARAQQAACRPLTTPPSPTGMAARRLLQSKRCALFCTTILVNASVQLSCHCSLVSRTGADYHLIGGLLTEV